MKQKIEWDTHIEAWQESGLSKAEYCRRNGINCNSFYQKTREQTGNGTHSLVALPFSGFQHREERETEPAFEMHFELPFHFRLRININTGRRSHDPHTNCRF